MQISKSGEISHLLPLTPSMDTWIFPHRDATSQYLLYLTRRCIIWDNEEACNLLHASLLLLNHFMFIANKTCAPLQCDFAHEMHHHLLLLVSSDSFV